MSHTLQRREFLSLATAAVVAPAVFPGAVRAQTASSRQKFKVGHNLTTYISGGKGPDGFWQGVTEISSLGVHGTEADDGPSKLTATYGADPRQVRDRLAQTHTTLVAIYHTLPLSDPSKYQDNIDSGMRVGGFLKAVGGDIINLAGGPRPQPDPTGEIKVLAKLVNELGKRLREQYGLRLGIHPHRGHLIENGSEIKLAMELTNPDVFSLCPDTGHLLAADTDPLEIFKTYRSRIIYMHYKDYDPNLVTPRTAETGRKGGFVELGKGVVDFPSITKLLLDTSYDGWAMIELDRAPAAPIDAVKTNLNYMTATLGLKLA